MERIRKWLTDTLVASAKAYLGALNKLVMKHERDNARAKVAAAE